jgi:NADH-ubiquinone oxidoreductase chain 6
LYIFILNELINIDIIYNNILLLFVSSKMWDGNIATESNHISSIGNILYTNYNIWLILSCLILLLAIVGAIVITSKNSGLSSNDRDWKN